MFWQYISICCVRQFQRRHDIDALGRVEDIVRRIPVLWCAFRHLRLQSMGSEKCTFKEELRSVELQALDTLRTNRAIMVAHVGMVHMRVSQYP